MRVIALLAFVVLPHVAARADDRESHFESRVRPILARHCIGCHGAEKQEAELRLDVAGGPFDARGDAGAVVVRGKPAESRFLTVLAYDEFDVQMPPAGKLPAEVIADLERWIRDGAYWPKKTTISTINVTDESEIERLRSEHWSFRPVERTAAPATVGSAAGPIDAFVSARLSDAGVEPGPRADRRTLVRRLYFDLHGLPPTYEQVEAFAADESPDAYERLVDRLLASPRFGERWGRHWLDVARYADTKGYVFTEDRRYPFAYTYRDYVVRAFNEDERFDQFVLEQLAADQLDLAADPRAIAGLGFLTVGRRFMNREPEIIDDRIDVVTRGLLGLTVSCARCHDHKYDPVPTADYYSLYGVFDSSHEPKELPLAGMPEESAAYDAYQGELQKRQRAHDEYLDTEVAKVRSHLRTHVGDYLAAIVKKSGRVPDEYYVALSPGDTRPRIVTSWVRYLTRRTRADDPVFGPIQALTEIPAKEFEPRAAAWLEDHCSDARYNPILFTALVESKPKSMYDVTAAYGRVFAGIEERWQKALEADRVNAGNRGPKEPGLTALDDPSEEQLRKVLYGDDSPIELSRDEARKEFDRATRNRERALNRKIDEWRASSPDAPARAMVLLDDDRPTEPAVFIRGTPGRRGERVPRRTPRIVSGLDSPAFQQGSGRLELARAIADPANPLTARVFVNRVWQHLLGRGLVTTPSDFGLRSDPPSHPRLLDRLAADFVANEWSVKRLVREIVLSETYRRSSDDLPEARSVDPENRLLWRANRRRLDFEAGRDAVLAVSGRLDDRMYGRPVDVTNPTVHRRTIYGTVDRNNLPTLFRTFDFASPDTSTGVRPTTTVPQQALFGLNSPFALEAARSLAGRVADEPDAEARVRRLYRLALSRDPSSVEASAGARFLASAEGGKLAPLERLAHVLLLTNEFAFVD